MNSFRLIMRSQLALLCFKRHTNTVIAAKAVLLKKISLPVIGIGIIAHCETTTTTTTPYNFNWDSESLEHEFLIKQACTVNINAASQLLTVTLVAIQDTSRRLRDFLSQEISLVKQAVEWGDNGTPPEHWERLIDIRGQLLDLKHNLQMLTSYMEYAEKLGTTAAEISFLSGNTAASDAICERIEHATRVCRSENESLHSLQVESLELQQVAINMSQQMEQILKGDDGSEQIDGNKTQLEKKQD